MNRMEAARRWKDPCALTPYENRILELMNNGKTAKEISAELNLKNITSLRATMVVIREKLAYAQN